jgi:hypothetical protein
MLHCAEYSLYALLCGMHDGRTQNSFRRKHAGKTSSKLTRPTNYSVQAHALRQIVKSGPP